MIHPVPNQIQIYIMVYKSLEILTGSSVLPAEREAQSRGLLVLKLYLPVEGTYSNTPGSWIKLLHLQSFLLKQQSSVKSIEAEECYIEWREAVADVEKGPFQLHAFILKRKKIK